MTPTAAVPTKTRWATFTAIVIAATTVYVLTPFSLERLAGF